MQQKSSSAGTAIPIALLRIVRGRIGTEGERNPICSVAGRGKSIAMNYRLWVAVEVQVSP
jgi:hypothetical protein